MVWTVSPGRTPTSHPSTSNIKPLLLPPKRDSPVDDPLLLFCHILSGVTDGVVSEVSSVPSFVSGREERYPDGKDQDTIRLKILPVVLKNGTLRT